ncbi:methyl-accepting chemotaxis protein [Stappia sediminis]|nr:HAMP domain-containing methyl-accepting chemotaxis protein [Stappia sediminis]
MLRNKLSTKLALMFFAGAALMCAAIVIATSQLASGVANTQADKALTSATLGKRKAMELTLQQVNDSARFFATLPSAKDSIMKMRAGWKNLKENQTEQLLRVFVENNPNAADQRHLLVEPGDDSYYATNHKVIHTAFQEMVGQGVFSDVALSDPDGNIVYSYRKGDEFARNVDAEELSGNPVQMALKPLIDASRAEKLKAGDVFFSGFTLNDRGSVTAVVSTPVFYLDSFFGAVAFTIDMQGTASVLNGKTGIGKSELSMLVASNTLVRLADDGTTAASFPMDKVKTSDDTLTLGGEDYRFSQAAGEFLSRPFQVVEAVEQSELSAAASTIILGVILAGGLCLIPFAGVQWWLTNRMFKPLGALSDTSRTIADGNLDVTVEGAGRADEIGEMARCIEVFKENAVERERLAAERKVGHIAREKRQEAIDRMIASFRSEMQTMLEAVEKNLEHVETLSGGLTDLSATAAGRGGEAAEQSSRASANVQAVASATEELNASIEEIARQVATTAQIVEQTTANANASNQKIGGLAEAANRIGDVVSLISEIAEQTNLLALNATIEAARAGEAGKGFAVVASEVKSLAGQTAKATEEISAQISAIQASTADAVDQIATVTGSVEEVNRYTASIAAAVRQQGGATSEISSNVAEAAEGTRTVSEAISSLSESVGESSESASVMRAATLEMKDHATRLRSAIDSFLDEVAAA